MERGARTLFDGDHRRPLLGGGERLREEVKRPPQGGDKKHPQTLEEALALLTPQLKKLRETATDTPPSMRGSRHIIEAKVLPNYLAGSYFPGDLFAAAKLDLVGVRVGRGEYRTKTSAGEERETKNYLLAGDETSFAELERIFRGEIGKRKKDTEARNSLRYFDMLRYPGPEQTLRGHLPNAGDEITWEAVFHPSLDPRGAGSLAEREEVWRKWLQLIKSLGGKVAAEYRHEVKELLFVPVRLSGEAATQAAAFNPLRALRPMPTLEPTPVLELRGDGDSGPTPPQGSKPRSDLRVAVFDGGVDQGVLQLAPFVTSTDLTTTSPRDDYVDHGTVVTASVLFGPDHGGGSSLNTPEVGVDHYRVLPVAPNPDFDLDLVSVLDQIEETVISKGHKIVNLSIGPRVAVEDDDEPHAWTARLDALAERYDVLFVSAVGNDGAADPSSGAHRIQVPSDMVNGLGIGACDGHLAHSSWARAPYSSQGPGRPGARMQPVGVAFGGVAARPFRGIGRGGRVVRTAGTSFAAPTAVHGLSALAAKLRPQDWDPSVLRVFAVQYAEAPSGDPLHHEVGFGRLLERYDETFECEPNEATILYRDELERGQMISLPLPLPAALEGRSVALKWSLAFSSPTDPRNPIDYTQASLETTFRPHARVHRFSKKRSKTEVLNLDHAPDAERAIELLTDGYRQSDLPVTDDYHHLSPESLRRSEGKWETILHAQKSKRIENLHKPQITVLYLARQDGALAHGPPLQFAMLANLRASPGVPLYDEIRSSYPVLSPIRTQLPVRITT
jgi:hypothetical protein